MIKAKLTLYEQDDKKDTFTLEDETIIGRSELVDIPIPMDIMSSRRHAQILLTKSGATIIDMGSTNGVFVNGELISSETELKHKDKIIIGETHFVFEIDGIASTSTEDKEQTAIVDIDDDEPDTLVLDIKPIIKKASPIKKFQLSLKKMLGTKQFKYIVLILMMTYASYIVLAPPSKTEVNINQHFEKGLTYAKLGKYEDAIVHWQEILKLDSENAKAINNIQLAEEKIKERDKEIPILLEKVQYCFSIMDFVSALQYCDEILKLQVDHKETLELREQIQQQEMMNNYLDNGMLYYLNKETEKAITEFELVLIISPDHDEAKDYLLDLYKKQVNVSNDEDDYVTSLASWLRVRDLAPGDKEAKREIYRLERSLTEEERKAAITASKPPTEIPANRATIASSATPTPIAATTPITPPTPTPTTTTPTTTRPTTTTPTTTRPTTTRPTTTRPTTTRPTTTTPTTTTPTTIQSTKCTRLATS